MRGSRDLHIIPRFLAQSTYTLLAKKVSCPLNNKNKKYQTHLKGPLGF